jgi:hypothetical protein
MKSRRRMTDLNTGNATVKARHINVLHRTKGRVRHWRLEMHTLNRRRSVLIVTHDVWMIGSGSLGAYSDIGDGRLSVVGWSGVDEGSRMKLREREDLWLLRRRRDETGWYLVTKALSRIGTGMPLQRA